MKFNAQFFANILQGNLIIIKNFIYFNFINLIIMKITTTITTTKTILIIFIVVIAGSNIAIDFQNY